MNTATVTGQDCTISLTKTPAVENVCIGSESPVEYTYVVKNTGNFFSVSGKVVDTITDPNFDVPTTIARSGDSLYVVNARFSTTPTPDTTYSVERVGRK